MSTKSFLAFAFGAAAGAAATYFFTSEKTAETRSRIKAKAEEELEPLKKQFNEKMDPIKKKVLEGLNKTEQALENL